MDFTLSELEILLKAVEEYRVFCVDHEEPAQAKETAITKLRCAIVLKKEEE